MRDIFGQDSQDFQDRGNRLGNPLHPVNPVNPVEEFYGYTRLIIRGYAIVSRR